MNDNIDKNEIRKAIDRLQEEHPCGIAYDPTAFVNMEAVNTIKGCIDKIARRMMEDTEINIICEFAKLYLEGAKPTIEKPHGEWVQTYYSIDGVGASRFKCSKCENEISKYGKPYNFCPNCGADMREEGDRN